MTRMTQAEHLAAIADNRLGRQRDDLTALRADVSALQREVREQSEHLRDHLTDGRWHDSCPYCLRRREQGGTGVDAAPESKP